MNKTLLISLVAALGVAGGGYMLMDSEKNYSEYIPEPVAELIGGYLPANFQPQKQLEAAETTFEVYQENVFVEDTMATAEEYVQEVEQGMEQTDAVVTEQPYDSEPNQVAVNAQPVVNNNSGYSEPPQAEQAFVYSRDEQEVNTQTEVQNINQDTIEESSDRIDESVVEVAMNEIQDKLSESLESVTSDSNDPQAVSMVNQINATTSEISRLDLENKALEDKFQKILRKNRERAKQLAEIDSQLAQLTQLN